MSEAAKVGRPTMVLEEVSVANSPAVDGEEWERLGALISERREHFGLTKAEAARRAQVSPTTWRAIEKAQHESPTDTVLIRMANVLQLDPAEVLAVVGRNYAPPAPYAPRRRPAPSVVDDIAYEDRFLAAIRNIPGLDLQEQRFLLEAFRMVMRGKR